MAADRTDWTLALSKGALGAIPFVGPLAAEVVGVLIPNQRIDRLERFLADLEANVSDLKTEDVSRRFQDPGFVDLLEDGFYQAARSLSDERLGHIAALVAHGLSRDDIEFIRLKKMLSILGSLNDAEILFLIMYGRQGDERRSFMNEHPDVLVPKSIRDGASDDDREAVLAQRAFKAHLIEVGLLRPGFASVQQGEIPEFDSKTGMLKASGYRITPLGRMFLKYIDQLPSD